MEKGTSQTPAFPKAHAYETETDSIHHRAHARMEDALTAASRDEPGDKPPDFAPKMLTSESATVLRLPYNRILGPRKAAVASALLLICFLV